MFKSQQSAVWSAPLPQNAGNAFQNQNMQKTGMFNKPAGGGGLFTPNQPATNSGGLFGAQPTASAPAEGGMFTSQAQPTSAGGLFGAQQPTQAAPNPQVIMSQLSSDPHGLRGLDLGKDKAEVKNIQIINKVLQEMNHRKRKDNPFEELENSNDYLAPVPEFKFTSRTEPKFFQNKPYNYDQRSHTGAEEMVRSVTSNRPEYKPSQSSQIIQNSCLGNLDFPEINFKSSNVQESIDPDVIKVRIAAAFKDIKECYVLSINTSWKVSELIKVGAEELQKKYKGLDQNSLTIMGRGEILSKEKTLEEAGVRDGDELMLVFESHEGIERTGEHYITDQFIEHESIPL